MNRKVIYIASAYSGDVNANFQKYLERVAIAKRDHNVIVVTWAHQHLLEVEELLDWTYKQYLEADFELINLVEELWAFDFDTSNGVQEEVKHARSKDITVKFCRHGVNEIIFE